MCLTFSHICYARVAQLVEHDLAKVGAAGSSPVSRSFFILWEALIYRVSHFSFLIIFPLSSN